MLTIRIATIDDVPSLTGLLKILFSFEKDFSFNEKKQDRGLRQIIDNKQGHILVAEVNGCIIGMCSGQLTVSTAEGGLALLVEDVVVSGKWRSQGVGKRLVDEITEWARRKGVSRLQLLADKTNESALNFYKNIGWKSTQLICLRKHLT